jgi:hypothetical protein
MEKNGKPQDPANLVLALIIIELLVTLSMLHWKIMKNVYKP